MRKAIQILVLALLVGAVSAHARTKLVALPTRDAVSIRLDNPAATLVQEERVLTLQEGTNHIDFSWEGVNIDPNSIRIRMLSHPDRVNLISVSYPPNEDALVWQIYSEQAGEERVRISYLLSNIDRLVTYRAVAAQEEDSLSLRSYLVLRNFSGEDFENAHWVLSDNASFTTGIRHGETKRTLFFKKLEVPISKRFTWDAAKKPHDPEKQETNVGIPVEYVIENTEKAGLGTAPLWGGKARIYQEDGHGSTIFLGEDTASYTPVGDKAELFIGESRDIVVTQRRMSSRRTNIRRDNSGQIEVYDENIHEVVKVENFKDEKATLTIVEHISGQWKPVSFSHEYEREDHSTLKFHVDVPAGGEVNIDMQYRLQNVFNVSQWRRYNTVRD